MKLHAVNLPFPVLEQILQHNPLRGGEIQGFHARFAVLLQQNGKLPDGPNEIALQSHPFLLFSEGEPFSTGPFTQTSLYGFPVESEFRICYYWKGNLTNQRRKTA